MSEEEKNSNEQEATLAQQLASANVSSPKTAEKTEKSADEGSSEKKEKVSLAKKLLNKETIEQKRRERKIGDLFTGRRKSSIARVKIVKGTGKILVNKKELSAYFAGLPALQGSVKAPIIAAEVTDQFDFFINIKGGGIRGQADAASLGVARAIETIDPAKHQLLRQKGFLTRDSRTVERKKFGLHKARRAPQFSKR